MEYYSSGKLLISGEYLVLKGAVALAVPLNVGQNLLINNNYDFPGLVWESREKGQTWFRAKFELPFFDTIETTDKITAKNLAEQLKMAAELNPEFVDKCAGKTAITNMEFARIWGFGSSSSLLSNIAWWAEIDPFELHTKVSSGSGYDVVCSREKGPIFFQLTKEDYSVESLDLPKDITDLLYFVYLGKKQDSAESVGNFLKRKKRFKPEIELVSNLSRHLGNSTNLDDFEYYMKEHEQIMSSILKKPTLKETVFKSLEGEAKSLGAWGGDFAMVTWTRNKNELIKHLQYINLNTLFSWKELVKTR